MSLLKRRRLVFWLFKAYLKKSGKMILLSFVIGLILFFLLTQNLSFIFSKLPFRQQTVIGVMGSYTVDTLPNSILSKISRGLTKVSDNGLAQPDLAQSWVIKDNGKTYEFILKKNEYFSNGKNFTSDDVNYQFADVVIERPSKYDVIFKLKESYSPFLITVSRPLFQNDFVGLGAYKVQNLKLNGNFIESLTLVSKSDAKDLQEYLFYPTADSLKTAYVLGEVDNVSDLTDIQFKNTTFATFSNTAVKKETNYRELVTLFYNTKDGDISNRLLRDAFNYALPNTFSQGQRNPDPYPPQLWVTVPAVTTSTQDIEHAKLLIAPLLSGTKSATLSFTLKTLPQYNDVAKAIAVQWKKAGISLKIETVDHVPADFQIFLGNFLMPKDPDQYTLWHSGQSNNITNYDDKRIDKLLEDGRKTIDNTAREKIYQDFQKYLADDPPASFLFFPYVYTIERK